MEDIFLNHSPKICSLITPVVNGVMAEILKVEFVAIFFEKLQKAGYSEDRIIKGSKSYFEHDEANVPQLIKKLGIPVT